jgi:hypothetical protein
MWPSERWIFVAEGWLAEGIGGPISGARLPFFCSSSVQILKNL